MGLDTAENQRDKESAHSRDTMKETTLRMRIVKVHSHLYTTTRPWEEEETYLQQLKQQNRKEEKYLFYTSNEKGLTLVEPIADVPSMTFKSDIHRYADIVEAYHKLNETSLGRWNVWKWKQIRSGGATGATANKVVMHKEIPLFLEVWKECVKRLDGALVLTTQERSELLFHVVNVCAKLPDESHGLFIEAF